MPEPVRIQFYDVAKCGFYDEEESHQFCSFADLMTQVGGWSLLPGQTFRRLRTFQSATEADPPTVYLVHLWHHAATGDYLLATWNETPGAGGNTSSLRADNAFGQPVVDESPLPQGNIPGYPTYFWLLPTLNRLATIKTTTEDSLHNGHRGLCRFFKDFMARCSTHVVHAPGAANANNAHVNIVGYRATAASPIAQVQPQFQSHPSRRLGPIDEIRAQRQSITKIIYHHTLRTTEHLSRRAFQRLLIMLTGEAPPPLEHTTKFSAELTFTPTSEQLESVISTWQQSPQDSWNDVGFKIRDIKGTLWLSGIYVKTTPQLPVTRNLGVINGSLLLEELSARRAQMVALLPNIE